MPLGSLDTDAVYMAAQVVETQGRCLITRPATPDWAGSYDFDFVLDLDESLRLLLDQMEHRRDHYGRDAIESHPAHTPEAILAKHCGTEHGKAHREGRMTMGASTPEEDYMRDLWEGVPTRYKQKIPLPQLYPDYTRSVGVAATVPSSHQTSESTVIQKHSRGSNSSDTDDQDAVSSRPQRGDWTVLIRPSETSSQGTLLHDSTCVPRFPARRVKDPSPWMTSG